MKGGKFDIICKDTGKISSIIKFVIVWCFLVLGPEVMMVACMYPREDAEKVMRFWVDHTRGLPVTPGASPMKSLAIVFTGPFQSTNHCWI